LIDWPRGSEPFLRNYYLLSWSRFPLILWNPHADYRVPNSPLLVLFPRQINSFSPTQFVGHWCKVPTTNTAMMCIVVVISGKCNVYRAST